MAFTEEAISAWQQFIQQKGNAYQLSYWKSSTEPVLADGTVANWTPADRKTGTPASIQVNGGAKESLDHYAVTGIKYVPVQVKAPKGG